MSANFSGDGGVLEEERALEELTAVQTRTQNKVPVEQRASFTKKGEKIFGQSGRFAYCQVSTDLPPSFAANAMTSIST